MTDQHHSTTNSAGVAREQD